jgi:hypothetical protein
MKTIQQPGIKDSWKGLLAFIPTLGMSLLFWWLIYLAVTS